MPIFPRHVGALGIGPKLFQTMSSGPCSGLQNGPVNYQLPAMSIPSLPQRSWQVPMHDGPVELPARLHIDGLQLAEYPSEPVQPHKKPMLGVA
jgi:hypothetical protein